MTALCHDCLLNAADQARRAILVMYLGAMLGRRVGRRWSFAPKHRSLQRAAAQH